MKKRLNPLLAFSLLFCTVFLDGQFSTLVFNLSGWGAQVWSGLTLLLLVLFSHRLNIWLQLLFFMLAGFLYDLMYLQLLGIATIFFPLLSWLLARLFQSIERNVWTLFLSYFLISFVFLCLSYGIPYLFHLTNLSVISFVLYALAPTLVWNSVLYLFLLPFMLYILQVPVKS